VVPTPEAIEAEVALMMHGSRPDPPKAVAGSVYRHSLASFASSDALSIEDVGTVSPESKHRSKAKRTGAGGLKSPGKTLHPGRYEEAKDRESV
jgi:hypothetical protein